MAIYSFIAEEQANPDSDWTVAECCRTLEVSRSGYYDWVSREPGPREVTDRVLTGPHRCRLLEASGCRPRPRTGR